MKIPPHVRHLPHRHRDDRRAALLRVGLGLAGLGPAAACGLVTSQASGSAPDQHPGRDRLVSRPVLGIDLGTTNSVVASVDDQGKVVVLRNALGDEITPSVVFFEPGRDVVVGEEALQATAVEPG